MEDSYFLLAGDLDLPTDSETSPGGEVLDSENYQFLPYYGRPSQQLVSSCLQEIQLKFCCIIVYYNYVISVSQALNRK